MELLIKPTPINNCRNIFRCTIYNIVSLVGVGVKKVNSEQILQEWGIILLLGGRKCNNRNYYH